MYDLVSSSQKKLFKHYQVKIVGVRWYKGVFVYACVCVYVLCFKTRSYVIQAILRLAMLMMTLNC